MEKVNLNKVEYSLEELLVAEDKDFIRLLYFCLLKREPDSQGGKYYLSRLRSGISKENIIYQMVKSPEVKNIKVKGLKSYIFWDKLLSFPVVGNILSMLIFILTIRSHLREIRILENKINRIYSKISSEDTEF